MRARPRRRRPPDRPLRTRYLTRRRTQSPPASAVSCPSRDIMSAIRLLKEKRPMRRVVLALLIAGSPLVLFAQQGGRRVPGAGAAAQDAAVTVLRPARVLAGYSDVELKQAVDQGIIPGPRMIVVTRAIVATGSYGPKGFALEWRVPQGAEEADGESLIRVVRDQIGHGADWIKVYEDYRWGP